MQARDTIVPKFLHVRWLSILVIGASWILVACYSGCREKKSVEARREAPSQPRLPAVATCRSQTPAAPALGAPTLALDAGGFSVSNSRQWLRVVTAPGLAGRPAGSKHSLRLARLLASQLLRFGLRPGLEDGSYCQGFRMGEKGDQNVVARRPSTPAGGPLIIVGAHYDSLGLQGGKPHPGADDNASGVAALMEIARLLGRGAAPGVEVLVIAFGGEEKGLLGSKHYVSTASKALGQARLMINLDMVGRQLLEGQQVRALLGDPKDTIGYVVSDRGSDWTQPLLKRTSRKHGISVVGIPEDFLKLSGFLSDSVPFSPHVPTVFFSTSLHDDYGKLTDTPDKIDHSQIQRTVVLVLALMSQTHPAR